MDDDFEDVFGVAPRPGDDVARFAGRYPLPLLGQIAAATADAIREHDAELARTVRPYFGASQWIVELADSLAFRKILSYDFRKAKHINVNETMTFRTFVKLASRIHPDSRAAALLDSRVALGCQAKGRSSSPSLTHVLRSSLPYLLGGNVYVGGLHVPSELNRGDAPSRHADVPGPVRPWPSWLLALQRGDTRHFDRCLLAEKFIRPVGRWVRILLLLAGDIEPHPGPKRPLVPRDPQPLIDGALSRESVSRRCAARSLFELWLQTQDDVTYDQIGGSGFLAAVALQGFAKYLFELGAPRYLAVEAILAFAGDFEHWRSHLRPAWRYIKRWEQLEPGQCRMVIPAAAMRAIACVGLAWGWWRWTAATLLGFAALLHPCEFLQARRQHLVLPRDHAFGYVSDAYLHLPSPKTRRFARHQHARISDLSLVRLFDLVWGDAPMTESLVPFSATGYRRRWNSVLGALELPTGAPHGLTPGALRGSGATFLYLSNVDVPGIAWRGRWRQVRNLEYYLQEVAGQQMLNSLAPRARQRIEWLSDLADGVIAHCVRAEVSVPGV